ncbi:MAG: cytochrome c biogenesis protein CcsA [Bacteroidota bacterium]
MNWQFYQIYVCVIIVLWILGSILLYSGKRTFKFFSDIFVAAGVITLIVFISNLWTNLDRPPFRTLAETRLWYAFFLAFLGLLLYYRWKIKWLLVYSLFLSIVFLLINYFKPDTFDQTLMPALQSPWFIPHVIVYMFAYALLSVSAIIATRDLFLLLFRNKDVGSSLNYADNLVYMGFAFLTFGLLFGALWAKQAWGHYWTWDPKETWAFITWLVYLIYIHTRYRYSTMTKLPLWILTFAMIFLLICWLGINYLAVAQNSVHTYTQ